MIRKTGSKTILDYGSGKGLQYSEQKLHVYWDVAVTCFDPAVYEHGILHNGTWDGVICTDVLEHIPESDIAFHLGRMFRSARKFVFVTVCCRPAKKTFSDGTNVHVTVKPLEWWHRQIAQAAMKSEKWDMPYWVIETP